LEEGGISIKAFGAVPVIKNGGIRSEGASGGIERAESPRRSRNLVDVERHVTGGKTKSQVIIISNRLVCPEIKIEFFPFPTLADVAKSRIIQFGVSGKGPLKIAVRNSRQLGPEMGTILRHILVVLVSWQTKSGYGLSGNRCSLPSSWNQSWCYEGDRKRRGWICGIENEKPSGQIQDVLYPSSRESTRHGEVKIHTELLVESKTRLAGVSAVASWQTGHQFPFRVLLIPNPNPIKGIFACLPPVDVFSQESTVMLHDQTYAVSLGLSGMFGHDINNAAHRIGTPDRSAWSTDDFNPVENT